MKFQLGAMSIGDILDRGLKLTLSRFVTLFAIQFVALLPAVALVVGLPLALEGNPFLAIILGLVSLAAMLILGPLSSAATVKVVAEEYMGRKVGFGEALNFAMQRVVPLLGTSLLAGIAIMLYAVLLVIPGIMAALSYAFIGQVVVFEKLSGMQALSRSANLVSGFRWRLFGLLLLISLLNFVIMMGLGGLKTALPPREMVQFGTELLPIGKINVGNFLLNVGLEQLVSLILGVYIAVCTTLMYFDLRVRKEAFDLEVAASQA